MEERYQRVLYRRGGPDGAALWLTLNNEPMRNALDDLMQRELLEIFEKAAFDSSIRCIVVGAAGSKAFCSGGDIKAFQALDLVSSYDYVQQRGNGYAAPPGHDGKAGDRRGGRHVLCRGPGVGADV